jgi:hypothetical protein
MVPTPPDPMGISIDATLTQVIELVREHAPFAAPVAQLARQATSMPELERYLSALYRIAIERECPYVAELVDGLLVEVEREITTSSIA